MGMASSRSRPLPCGTPSMMSIRTTSASSFEAIQWAAVAPTFPEPTMVTFLRMNQSFQEELLLGRWADFANRKTILAPHRRPRGHRPMTRLTDRRMTLHQDGDAHVLDDAVCELAGLYFGRAFHQTLKVIGDFFLKDGVFHTVLDQVGSLVPPQKAEHHHARKYHGTRIDHVFIRILGSGAMGCLKNRVTVTDVRAGCDAEPANLRRTGVGNVIPVQVRSSQNGILIRPRHHLLEDRIGDAVVDHDLVLPLAFAVRGVNAIEDFTHFLLDSLAKRRRSEFHARLNQFRILSHRQVRMLVFVVENPALALGHNLVAKFFGGQLVSPFAERALGKLLDVSLMHQGHALAIGRKRVLNRHADQTLGSGDRNWFDADAGIEPNLLLAALEHVLVEELDQLLALCSSLLPLDADVHVFGVLAEDHQVHALGMLHRRGHALVVLHRAHAAEEIQSLAQRHIERTDAAAHRRGERTFDRDAELADRVDGVIGPPGIDPGFGFFAGEHFIPGDAALALVGFLNGCIEHAKRRFPDVAPGSVAFDKWNHRIIRHIVVSVGVANLPTIRRNIHTVIRTRHSRLPVEFPSNRIINLYRIPLWPVLPLILASPPLLSCVTTVLFRTICARLPSHTVPKGHYCRDQPHPDRCHARPGGQTGSAGSRETQIPWR